MGFAGFNNKKRNSLGGDFDGDGIKNRKDCAPMNWKKQGPEHEMKEKYGEGWKSKMTVNEKVDIMLTEKGKKDSKVVEHYRKIVRNQGGGRY